MTRRSTYQIGSALKIMPEVFKNLKEGKDQTVVLYGTSLTEKGAWAEALRDWFNRNYPQQVKVINTAGSGMNSDWGLRHLEERVIQYHPDLVFIEFAYNDAHDKFDMPIKRSKDNLDAIVQRILNNNPRTTLLLQTMNDGWDAPIGNGDRSHRPQLDDYNQNYRVYANEHDLELFDHFQIWHALKINASEAYQAAVPDGSHPTVAGSLQYTWPLIESWLNLNADMLA